MGSEGCSFLMVLFSLNKMHIGTWSQRALLYCSMRRYLASEELTAQPAEALCQFGFLVIRLTRFLKDKLYFI